MEKVNLIGQTFYDLTVIEEVECTNKKGVKPQLWKCRCVCGNEVVLSTTKLINEYPKSCGCRTHRPKTSYIEDVGKQFGGWTVLGVGQKRHSLLCQCVCGTVKEVDYYNLRKGATTSCGCIRDKLASTRRFVDLQGQKFGRLTVMQRAPNKVAPSGYQRTMWTCLCDCGTIKDYQADLLTRGETRSCGCLKRELTSERLSLHLEGQKFGKLTVIERAGTFVGEDGLKYSQWLCECECGSTKVVRGHDLVRGSVSSCGCLISKGEMLVRQELNKYNVEYKTQWWFDDLRLESGRPTRFDFALLRGDDLLGLIEYHGVQHYKEQPAGFGEQQRESTDLLKSAYCYKHHIRLWVIAYDQDISLKNSKHYERTQYNIC